MSEACFTCYDKGKVLIFASWSILSENGGTHYKQHDNFPIK